MKRKATKITREAIGRDCQVRLSGCNTSPCCLAHFRLSGVSGMGLKPHDILGAWACDFCHSQVDTRKGEEIQLAFAHGVIRTQNTLINEGKITW